MNRRDVLKVAAASPALLQAQSGWEPQVFTTHQNETAIVLSDLIIPATDTPGAKAANVNRYIDLMLSELPSEREQIVKGLDGLDETAKKDGGDVFIKLAPAKQVALLERLDKENDRFFRAFKAMTARVYYSTQIGYKELNKNGVPRGFGCSHDGHKA